ncbi:PREDICTED: agamous-like MADS-box protein AGL49 [Camelina sativa]|uniref:Agamous-like MADS-box protein AGL49 n=1 Tax=Camelina sativa TaxID=90675 RepID=A0ABM0WGM8_CAMSA|nr:PREDICTED: agamous-like MADS-box protein AGL49 [Camelina sativa]
MAPRVRKVCVDDLKMKKKLFKQRFPGFKKKAIELSVLCGNSIGFVCYTPDDNNLHIWPDLQEKPQALTQLLAKFNALSDHKRKNNACDLYDFPDIKGLSGEDLRRHVDNLDSHLLRIKQQKISLLRRGNSKNPKPKETEEGDRVSDRLGFGHDVFGGYHETAMGSCAVSRDVGVSDSSLLDPFKSDYFPTDNFGVCANNGAWDLSWMDLDFSSTLFPAGYDPLLGATDEYQTLVTI